MITKKKKIIIGAAIAVVGIACIAEFGGAYYFQNHYAPKTSFNGVDVSGKSVEAAKAILDESLNTYTLAIKGDGTEDQLSASDIDLVYDSGAENTDIMNGAISDQKPFEWVADIVGSGRDYTLKTSYNAEKLNSAVSAMSCMTREDKVQSQNASVKYADGAFQPVEEVYGNELNQEEFSKTLIEQMNAGNTEYQIDCYIQPALTVESETFKNAKAQLDAALHSAVTIKRDDISVTLSADDIASMLTIGDDLTASVDKEKLGAYVDANIKDQFNTVGKERTVSTLGCGEFTISGGIYGYIVDTEAETEQLAQDILSGGTVEREPKYSQEETYKTNGGLGNTYIDVSISQQHVWLVYEGKLIIDTPCVTGNVANGTITPKGTYWIEFKRRNYGMPRYGVTVSYWMPIDTSTGVGLHDAGWRSTFGGSYYRTSGSHGCINLPVSAARTIYNNCFGTMPVVVH
ncbi:MAG: peptidoglycan binding domain-containing protein [Eubacteriales bacterium]|nr:peptidoglycan binding domain-containing protein [Eubacteriales bacterium]